MLRGRREWSHARLSGRGRRRRPGEASATRFEPGSRQSEARTCQQKADETYRSQQRPETQPPLATTQNDERRSRCGNDQGKHGSRRNALPFDPSGPIWERFDHGGLTDGGRAAIARDAATTRFDLRTLAHPKLPAVSFSGVSGHGPASPDQGMCEGDDRDGPHDSDGDGERRLGDVAHGGLVELVHV